MARKIFINKRGFYVIPECKKGDYTLCVASEPWGESIWGEDANGQQILDIADNRNPESVTSYWFNTLPDIIKAVMLTVSVTTDDFNEAGEGKLEQTEMFVPSRTEWEKVPMDIRRRLPGSAFQYVWSRSYKGTVSEGDDHSWYVNSDGYVFCNYYNQSHLFGVVPAFYISDGFLQLKEEKSEEMKMPPVIFTIWPNHRITTSNIQFRNLNTACCTDIRTLYESMQEISREVKEKCGRNVLFEVTEY